MSKPFVFAWALLATVVIATLWGAALSFQTASGTRRLLSSDQSTNEELARQIQHADRDLALNEEAAGRVTKFLKEWEPYTNPLADKKDRQAAILHVLEDEAVNLQDLLVGTPVTPQNKPYRYGDASMEVEQVQMKVSGPLTKTVVFLGRVEELFPYARVTRFSLEPTEGGHAINLDLQIVQPVKRKAAAQ